MSTTTTTESVATPSVALKKANSAQASFNYWGTDALPQVSDIHDIFGGTSSSLRGVSCTVSDIRPHGLRSFNLSTHAFQILQHSSALLPPQSTSVPDFHDSSLITSTYWPELISLLKSQLAVRSAVAINTTVRDVGNTASRDFNSANPRANPKQSFNPFFLVHGDYTPAGAR